MFSLLKMVQILLKANNPANFLLHYLQTNRLRHFDAFARVLQQTRLLIPFENNNAVLVNKRPSGRTVKNVHEQAYQ